MHIKSMEKDMVKDESVMISDEDFYDAQEFDGKETGSGIVSGNTTVKEVKGKIISPNENEDGAKSEVPRNAEPAIQRRRSSSKLKLISETNGIEINNEDCHSSEEDASNSMSDVSPPAAPVDAEIIAEEEKFIVKNQDTGEVYDIRNLEDQPMDKFSFFPDHFEPSVNPEEGGETGKKASKNRRFTSKMLKRKKKSTSAKDCQAESIPVNVSKKSSREFSSIFLSQKIEKHQGPIWTMKFSYDGMRLATGGQDMKLRVWKLHDEQLENLQSTSTEKTSFTNASSTRFSSSHSSVPSNVSSMGSDPSLSKLCNLLADEPEILYEGHAAPIIDVSWSRSNFLLSASMDKTVRLWHVSRSDCLHVFKHPDSVPAVEFHPKEDRYFLSGCFDSKVRIWDIPEGTVVAWEQTSSMITSASFNQNGSMAVVGLLNGKCIFYQTENLAYYTQIECRNQHGKLKGGRKVTGIEFAPGGKQVLITTNDSRMRLFSIGDYSRTCKYKGLVNDNLQIKASFSQDGEHIICGSENGQVYIWNTTSQYVPSMSIMNGMKPDRNASYESFKADSQSNKGIVTVALFAPASTYAFIRQNVRASRARMRSAAGNGSGILQHHDGVEEIEEDLHEKAASHFILAATYDGCVQVFQNLS